MRQKIIISGTTRMAALAREALEEIHIPGDIIVETTASDVLVYGGREKDFDCLGAQCVLVSGEHSALVLKEKYTIPVIPVKVKGFDLMQALIRASRYDSKVAVVNFLREMPEIEKFKGILTVPIHQFAYANREEAAELFTRLSAMGYRVVIGASVACDVAEEYGMEAIFLYSLSSMLEALGYAVDILTSSKKETERAETFKAIVDFTHNGIISTDSNFRITTFNPSAEKMLGLKPEEVIGRQFSEFFPEFALDLTGDNPKPKINALGEHGKTMVVFSALPILVDGQPCGQVTVLQDVATIQMAEKNIRSELRQKRFAAQHHFSDIVGTSPAIKGALEKARRFGSTCSAVLITGETGTGKELFAQSIHNINSRRDKPFVAVNCAALPESLLDSELFGYEQGAFTGARKGGKPGLFEMAHSGSIFLDEVTEISPALQARLLRVLQEKEVMRIGGDRLIPIDVRVISATNRNLRDLVQSGKFREDLYYRLGVLELHIPPLRDRREDIAFLIQSLLRCISPQLLHTNTHLLLQCFSELNDYPWPGNVRELENILERFAALANDASPDLKTYHEILKDCFCGGVPDNKNSRPGITLQYKANEAEQAEIWRTIKELEGNKSRAAEVLGISRSTLYRKCSKMKNLTH